MADNRKDKRGREPAGDARRQPRARARTAAEDSTPTQASPDSLDDLKEEVAAELGVEPDRYGGNVPAKTWGALGGHMVKRLIEKGEEALGRGGRRQRTGDDDDPPGGADARSRDRR
jgi:hypothetical protein